MYVRMYVRNHFIIVTSCYCGSVCAMNCKNYILKVFILIFAVSFNSVRQASASKMVPTSAKGSGNSASGYNNGGDADKGGNDDKGGNGGNDDKGGDKR